MPSRGSSDVALDAVAGRAAILRHRQETAVSGLTFSADQRCDMLAQMGGAIPCEDRPRLPTVNRNS
jgi:hypothetical protein